MKVLLDTCVAAQARDVLVQRGHDVTWGGDWPIDPGDEEILRRAFAERRVLVTLDKDFGELAVVGRMPHCGIVRLVDLSTRQQGPFCARVLERYAADLERGAIITVERGRVRVRPGEGQEPAT